MSHIAIRISLIAVTGSDTPFDSPRRNLSLQCRSLSRPFTASGCSPVRSLSPPSRLGAFSSMLGTSWYFGEARNELW
ncbi:hypothetical protein Taro_026967 [Colocasia esculenta]|uniref:Uncharacterized protein n=1 Tax=Colocasia esculenta TaxID=4460 RepID=A0A843V7H9_COLES|nr:hypothetical protein [Colocasia esculenta]